MNPTLIRKQMEQNDFDKVLGGVCGFFGGMVAYSRSFFLGITFSETLLKAAFTALVCGFMGVGGKYLFNVVQKWWKKLRSKKTK